MIEERNIEEIAKVKAALNQWLASQEIDERVATCALIEEAAEIAGRAAYTKNLPAKEGLNRLVALFTFTFAMHAAGYPDVGRTEPQTRPSAAP